MGAGTGCLLCLTFTPITLYALYSSSEQAFLLTAGAQCRTRTYAWMQGTLQASSRATLAARHMPYLAALPSHGGWRDRREAQQPGMGGRSSFGAAEATSRSQGSRHHLRRPLVYAGRQIVCGLAHVARIRHAESAHPPVLAREGRQHDGDQTTCLRTF